MLKNSLAIKSLRVLVVDDNLINQRMASTLLRQLGHAGVIVADGQKALLCMEKFTFDIVLMDVMMPVMDGMQALAAIRAKEAAGAKKTPVVMVTSHNDPGELERMLAAGADGYLPKPIGRDSLTAEFQRILNA